MVWVCKTSSFKELLPYWALRISVNSLHGSLISMSVSHTHSSKNGVHCSDHANTLHPMESWWIRPDDLSQTEDNILVILDQYSLKTKGVRFLPSLAKRSFQTKGSRRALILMTGKNYFIAVLETSTFRAQKSRLRVDLSVKFERGEVFLPSGCPTFDIWTFQMALIGLLR